MNEVKEVSDIANSLYGLPGDAVLALFALCLGWFLKLQSWYPNKHIPTAIMLFGVIGGPLMYMGHYDPKLAMTPQILTHIMTGGAATFVAWMLHKTVIKRFETKIPIIGPMLAEAAQEMEKPPEPTVTKVPLWFVALFVPVIVLASCTSFANHAFRVEQSGTHLCATAYFGWTNYLAQFPVTPQASNTVKTARLKAAASLKSLRAFRLEYQTNGAVKPQLTALLVTASDNVSNFVWVANFWQERK